MLNEQVSQYIPSSLTDARQTSSALFASWARMFGKLSLSVCARYEYVDYDFLVNGKRDEEASRRDHLLTPDVSLIYSFNDDAQISLSYKLATVKPPYSQLTGSLSYTGLHEIGQFGPARREDARRTVVRPMERIYASNWFYTEPRYVCLCQATLSGGQSSTSYAPGEYRCLGTQSLPRVEQTHSLLDAQCYPRHV